MSIKLNINQISKEERNTNIADEIYKIICDNNLSIAEIRSIQEKIEERISQEFRFTSITM